MIRETRDLPLVNRILGRDLEGADFTELLAEPLHVVLIEDESGAAFAWRGPGIYEAHVNFTVRGRAALELFRRMLAYMKAQHRARLFWGLIPLNDRRARMFTRLSGFVSLGEKETRNGMSELFIMEDTGCRL